MAVVRVTRPFINFGPNHILGICEARQIKFRVLIDRTEY